MSGAITNVDEIIHMVRITDVWRALGGDEPRRARARAFWRKNADDLNVSLNNEKGTWYDHARGEGGGILDLVQHVHGGDRRNALHWLAEFVGRPLYSPRWTRDQAREYGRLRHAAEREAARIVEWRDCLINLARVRRDSYLSAFHRARRHILRCGSWHDCCQFAADAADAYEVRYLELDVKIDNLVKASAGDLVEVYRSGGRVTA